MAATQFPPAKPLRTSIGTVIPMISPWPSPSFLHDGESPGEDKGGRGHSYWKGRQITVCRSVAS